MSEAAVRYQPHANRQSSFAVQIGHPDAGSVLIGYLRLDDRVRWVARTLGPAQAADIRRFRGRDAASVWLQQARSPPASAGHGLKIKILQQSPTTMVAPGHCVRQGDCSPGPFETRRMSRADRRHMSIGTVRGRVEL